MTLTLTPTRRAATAWGDLLPDWVAMLATACEIDNQTVVARRIGYSAAVVSTILMAKYPGDLTAVEKAVRGALGAAQIDCPVLGPIPSNDCVSNQRQPLSTASPQSVKLYRTCPHCPHGRRK